MTAPALRPAVGLGGLLVTLYTFSDFGVVSLMDYDTLTRAIYIQYRSLFDRAPAATLALVLVALTAIVARPRVSSETARPALPAPDPARSDRSPPSRLGAVDRTRARFLRGRHRAVPRAARRRPRLLARTRDRQRPRTRGAVGAGAQLTRGAGVRGRGGCGRRASRSRSSPSATPRADRGPLERLSYAGNALPGLVVALSLVFFAARYASPVYQTLALLVFAYVVRFFPQALSGDRGLARAPQPALRRGRARARTQLRADPRHRDRAARALRRPRGDGAGLPLGDEGAAGDDPAPPHRLRDTRDGDLEADPGRRLLAGSGTGTRPDRRLGTCPLPRLVGRASSRAPRARIQPWRSRTGTRSTSTWRPSTSSPSRSGSTGPRRDRPRSRPASPRCSASRAPLPARC